MTEQRTAKATVPASKWYRCTGPQFRKLVHAGMLWLEKNQQHVNALNVFPVPDGDTGTNMLLTMRSAYGRIESNLDESIGEVSHELAYGALMGARGNSGVILSQIWRGLARGLKDKNTADVNDLAIALRMASETAYKGVMRPVEGTILTVIREGSEEARLAADQSHDLRMLLQRVLARCQTTLQRTPDLLPELKQAGVVDSGGQGLVYILEGMLRYVDGTLLLEDRTSVGVAELPAQALAVPEGGVLENPYDVQFILMGRNLNVNEVRDTIDAMGDSTVVVGDETTIKVHVHVKDPGRPISYGIALGHITDVVVENMQMQMEQIVAGAPQESAAAASGTNGAAAAPQLQASQIGVVAVAPGDGLAEVLRSLGVAQIVSGGQTNNPSTEEIVAAIEEVPTEQVIVLPNNKNIILAAEAACVLTQKKAQLVPTRNVPQGVSAMLGWNPDGDFEETLQAMIEASQQVVSGEITTATRSVTLNGVAVETGQVIGLTDGRLCAAGHEMRSVLAQTLMEMEMEEREILSLYYGAEVAPAEAELVVREIQNMYPELEIELLAGGQPHYYFILGAE